MNVTELARRLKITPNKLREIMPQLGFDIGMRAIKVDPKMAQAIMEKLADPKVREKYLSFGEASEIKKISKEESVTKEEVKVIKIPDKIVVKELATRMNVPVTSLILELIRNGVMSSINQFIDYETAAIIAEDMGFRPEKTDEQAELTKSIDYEKVLNIDFAKGISRPPVVVVMGHVDHGKTKLLDAIRQTNIMEGEAGGITQHIGAYQVVVSCEDKEITSVKRDGIPRSVRDEQTAGRLLTFIDTPGHEAFSAMRSRGAQVADIAILLVAADDGVQPQTIEAVSHIKQAGLPFIVAINKIDKPTANIDKVKNDLAKIDLTPEDWGGKTICVPVSAKARTNLMELLETLFLVADMDKEKIVANPERAAVGTIIEAHVDKGEGPVATVLVQNGTLKLNDYIRMGEVTGRIRAMKTWKGESAREAPPSMPVRILGIRDVPQVGEILMVISDKKEFKKIGKARKTGGFSVQSSIMSQKIMPSEETKEESIKPQIKIILKADVFGSIEAILEALSKIKQDKVEVKVIKQGLGNISEADVENAVGLGAELIGFDVKVTPEAKKQAVGKGLIIRTYKIIYELLDFVAEKIKAAAGVEIVEKEIGKMKVLAIFRTGKNWQIIGGEIIAGKIIAQVKAKVYRNDELMGELGVSEVESGKMKVKEVVVGQQAGIKVEGNTEVKQGDILEIFMEEEK